MRYDTLTGLELTAVTAKLFHGADTQILVSSHEFDMYMYRRESHPDDRWLRITGLYQTRGIEYVYRSHIGFLVFNGLPATQNLTDTACLAPVRDRSRVVYDVAVVGGSITCSVVALRLLTKTPLIGGTFGWDDGWMTIATAEAIAYTIVNTKRPSHYLHDRIRG